MFTVNGQRFETVAIARLVILAGWTHVIAGPDEWGNIVGGCHDLVDRGITEDGERWITECGAEGAYDPEGRYLCTAGHAYTPMEIRDREGWDYVADEWDAAVVGRGGRIPVPMGPNTHIDMHEAARLMATI